MSKEAPEAKGVKVIHGTPTYSPSYTTMTEAQWQKTLLDAARVLGWTCYHTTFSIGSRSGFPDLVLFHPKYGTIYVEVKSQKGKLTANQEYWLGLIDAAGDRAYVWRPDDWDEAERILKGEDVCLLPGDGVDWLLERIQWRNDGSGFGSVREADVKHFLANGWQSRFVMLPSGSDELK